MSPRRSVAGWLLATALLAACGSATDDTAPVVSEPAPTASSQTESSRSVDETAVGAAADGVPADPAAPPPETVADTVPPTALDAPRSDAEASEADPVPVGEVVEIPDLWDLRVLEVDLDATDEVLAFAEINPAPEPGQQYLLITIEGLYLGERLAEPAFDWFVSDGTTEFRPSVPGCGVIEDSIYDVVEVIPGEAFDASMCVPIPSTSASLPLQLSLQPLGDRAWVFELV